MDYQADYSIKHAKGPAIKFPGGKRMDDLRKEAPGPGQYDSPANASKGITIPQSKGPKNSALNPGPGQYLVKESTFSPQGPSMGKSKRDLATEGKNGGVGPGSYNYPSDGQKGGQTIGKSSRSPLEGKEALPGPGQYDPAKSRPEYKFAMGIKTKDQNMNDAPGPGIYNPDYNAQVGKSSGYTIGKGKKDEFSNAKMPGPG